MMDTDEWREIKERTAALICRLPFILEYMEWSKRLDDADTEDEVLDVADQVVMLVNIWRMERGVDIPSRQPFSWIPQR